MSARNAVERITTAPFYDEVIDQIPVKRQQATPELEILGRRPRKVAEVLADHGNEPLVPGVIAAATELARGLGKRQQS